MPGMWPFGPHALYRVRHGPSEAWPMPYRDYFHDFVTKLLLRSNSLRNHESSPLFGTVEKGAGAPGQWPFDWKSAVPAADGAVK